MARINIVNADNKIDATPQRAYFKLKQTGGPKGEKGDTGAQGPIGPQGPQGASASVSVNSTTTLPAGSSATVENIGTAQNVKLNFGIPTGPQGPQGEQGPQGAQGPQGLKGDTGAKGADGAAAKVTVGNTNTGAAGTNASVENTGSETYAVLNFTIPRGDKGETGPMPDIAQTTGQATDEVMSQKATTDALATKQNNLTAGTGITIASDTVSADTTVLATKADLNDYAPQATTYTKAEADALLAQKLEAEVVAELPTTGEEGKLYLTPKAHTTSTATGNPITATVTDEAGKMDSFQLDGDTFQQSYTGANLIDIATTTGRTRLGITATPNADGSITFSGTASSTGNAELITYTGISPNLPAGDYTFSISKALPEQIYIHLNSLDGTTQNIIIPAGSTEASGTFTQALRGYDIRFHVQSGTTYSETIKMQLQSGTTAFNIEPFVGGHPSPNPDYPQPIQTVTGEQTVEIVGKNLFDKSNCNELACWINTGGKLQTGNNWIFWIPCLPSTTYTIQKMVQQPTAKNRFQIATSSVQPEIGTQTSGRWSVADGDTTTSHTYTTAADAKYLIFNVGNYDPSPATITTKKDILNSIQVELGSTATSYAPYHATSYPINLGKNLFDKNNATIYNAYIWATEFVLRDSYTDRTFLIPCLPNTTYTISRSIKTSSFRASYLDSDVAIPAPGSEPSTAEKYTCAQYVQNNTGSSITITTGANADRLIVHYGNIATDTNINESLATIQVEVGSQATTYAPYFTPIELCKIGDYQDYIWKDGDDWKVHKICKPITLNGSENWQYSSNYSFFFAGAITGMEIPVNAGVACYCRTHKGLTSSSSGPDFATEATNYPYAVNVHTTQALARIKDTRFSSTQALTDWLAQSNTTIYYVVKSPTDTTITDTTLIAQLEAIRTAALENGTNTITNSAAGSNLAGDMEITYYGYNPTNRYDKFIWLDLNNSYEQIGG